MAQIELPNIANRWFAALNASVTSGATSWVLKSSGATGIAAPCYVHCEAEIVKVTDIATDTPSAGLDTLTVERAQDGTTAASHAADTVLAQFFYSSYYEAITGPLTTLLYIANQQCGGTSGIGRPPTDSLSIEAEGTPSMAVVITAGWAMVNGQPVALRSDSSITFTAPSSDPRIDTIEIDQNGAVTAVTGTEASSPSAPAVTSGSLKLGEVYHTTAETSIKDADDATNGYINLTGRVYL